MSADNIIYVQKRKDGKFWVWLDFASNDNPKPKHDRQAKCYPTLMGAIMAAFDYLNELPIVEYGVRVLPEVTQEKKNG